MGAQHLPAWDAHSPMHPRPPRSPCSREAVRWAWGTGMLEAPPGCHVPSKTPFPTSTLHSDADSAVAP